MKVYAMMKTANDHANRFTWFLSLYPMKSNDVCASATVVVSESRCVKRKMNHVTRIAPLRTTGIVKLGRAGGPTRKKGNSATINGYSRTVLKIRGESVAVNTPPKT